MYTWFDKLMVLLSMGGLILFCGIIAYYVAEPDLLVIMTVVLCIALHDFWSSVFKNKRDGDD